MSNTEKFTGKSENYHHYRPGYGTGVKDYLQQVIAKEHTVADIGAGTGKFTEVLLEIGARVIAIEPNLEMRDVLVSTFGHHKNLLTYGGSAEATSLANESVDCITVAQAFHWFDHALFKKECQRILKSNGKVALIYNGRHEQEAMFRQLAQVNSQYCPHYKQADDNKDISKIAQFFKKGQFETLQFDNTDQLTKAQFIGRVLSASYALLPADNGYEDYIAALTAVFDKYEKNKTVAYGQTTVLYIGEI